MCSLYIDLPVRPKFIAENIKKPQLIHTSDCQIIAKRMESKCDERPGSDFPYPKIEHSQQFAIEIFVVPYPHSTIFIATGC